MKRFIQLTYRAFEVKKAYYKEIASSFLLAKIQYERKCKSGFMGAEAILYFTKQTTAKCIIDMQPWYYIEGFYPF
ncbi:hypothetical protein ACFOG5_15365 [Pedobacter fastidiosus]|uniref:hypothetical protein n=1 Tax=Pedobacter fastidiosus TaxID=2765361 RepID=UPI0036126E59